MMAPGSYGVILSPGSLGSCRTVRSGLLAVTGGAVTASRRPRSQSLHTLANPGCHERVTPACCFEHCGLRNLARDWQLRSPSIQANEHEQNQILVSHLLKDCWPGEGGRSDVLHGERARHRHQFVPLLPSRTWHSHWRPTRVCTRISCTLRLVVVGHAHLATHAIVGTGC